MNDKLKGAIHNLNVQFRDVTFVVVAGLSCVAVIRAGLFEVNEMGIIGFVIILYFLFVILDSIVNKKDVKK